MKILGVPVQPTSYQAAIAQIMVWAEKNESRYVCAANVHRVMDAHDSPEFMEVVNQADLVTPDRMPFDFLVCLWVLCVKKVFAVDSYVNLKNRIN